MTASVRGHAGVGHVCFNSAMNRTAAVGSMRTWWWFYFTVAAIAGVVAVTLVMTYWSSNWGPNHWGPVAAWFSGLMTVVAVSVSLYQTKLARDDAARAKLDATDKLKNERQRHAFEMTAADKRLNDQISAQWKRDQVKAVADLWSELHKLAYPTLMLTSALENLTRMADGRHPSELPTADLEPLQTAIDDWFVKQGMSDASFSTAVMIVDEPRTEELIRSLYKKTQTLRDLVEEVASNPDENFSFEHERISDAMMEIVKYRDPMMKSVRQHIVATTPLSPGAPTHDPLAESD